MFFSIKVKERDTFLEIYRITLADRLILEKIFTKKVRMFFKFRKKKAFLLPYYVIPKALALELAYLFLGAFEVTKKERYKNAYNHIIESTWIKEALEPAPVTIDMAKIKSRLNITPMDYQMEFIEHYFKSKESRQLRGLFLAFDQGLGKTATAIALTQLIEPEQTLIICPNNLKTVWWRELRKVLKKYKRSPADWEKETYVYGVHQEGDVRKKKYVIVNFESLTKAIAALNKEAHMMLIIDESHLIKEMTSSRTKMVLQLIKDYNFSDVLLQSGTPIKGLPHELLPILVILDTQFDDDTVTFYKKIIKTDDPDLLAIFNVRFRYLSFRKTKLQVNKTLNLPPKVEHDVSMTLPNIKDYEIEVVKEEISEYIKAYIESESRFVKGYRKKVDALVLKYKEKNAYLRKNYKAYTKVIKAMRGGLLIDEKERALRNEYERRLAKVMDRADKREFSDIIGRANNLYASALGKAIGNVYMGKYRQMVIDVGSHSLPILKDVFEKSKSKKVIVLGSYPEAVDKCSEVLSASGINNVKITGKITAQERVLSLEKFAEDDDIQFLVGTLEILSVGFTLVEADSLVFLNQPWRWVDKNQAADRIHRIGQVNTAHIYTIRLEHDKPTLSTRNNEIVIKSEDIFKRIIEGSDVARGTELGAVKKQIPLP